MVQKKKGGTQKPLKIQGEERNKTRGAGNHPKKREGTTQIAQQQQEGGEDRRKRQRHVHQVNEKPERPQEKKERTFIAPRKRENIVGERKRTQIRETTRNPRAEESETDNSASTKTSETYPKKKKTELTFCPRTSPEFESAQSLRAVRERVGERTTVESEKEKKERTRANEAG